MLKTSEELKAQAIKIGLTEYPVHDCSMCGYQCGYVFRENHEVVGYDSGCDCTHSQNISLRSWDDLARTYNMNQPENNPSISQEFLDKLNETWKFEEVSK